MAIDYAGTLNHFTVPDAYPISLLGDLLHLALKYRWFSYIDLQTAYHQVSLIAEERSLTAFGTDGGFWELNRLPLGLSKAVAVFQRTIQSVTENLSGIRPYLDDVVIGGFIKE